jgi:Domain of unknown function (DUF4397)
MSPALQLARAANVTNGVAAGEGVRSHRLSAACLRHGVVATSGRSQVGVRFMNLFRRTSLMLCGVLVVAACDNSSDDDGGDAGEQNPVVGAFNAVSDMSAVTFLREEEEWSSLEFGAGTEFRSVGPDQYDFNFDALLPGDDTTSCTGDDGDDVKDEDECTRIKSVSINALQEQEYAVILFGQYAAPEILVFDKPLHAFDTQSESADGDPADKNAEVQFFHLAQGLGALDVYIEPPGTNLSPVQARGSLAQRGSFTALVDEDDYVLTLTAVADPGTVYFTSETFAIDRQTRVAFAIRDGAGSGTSPVVVTEFRDRSATLLDRNATTELRIAHVAPLSGNVDAFVGGNFMTPFVANLAFTQISAYRQVDPTALIDLDVDVTPAGNPGVFLAREELSLTEGERATFFLLGASPLDGLKAQDNFRRLATHSQLRMINGAKPTLDFYVVKRGSNIATLSPTSSLAFRSSSGLQQFAPGNYDIVLTKTGTSTIVFGPNAVVLSGSGIYSVVATDTGEATAASIKLLDDFAN